MSRYSTRSLIVGAAVVAGSTFGITSIAAADPPDHAAVGTATVCIDGSGECYGSIVTPTDLPDNGPFQDLWVDGGLVTALAPGDPGYSPRWDLDGTLFVCPLLPGANKVS